MPAPDNTSRIDAIFAEAGAITDPAQRAAYLAQACAGDTALRAEVESLLAADQGAADFMKLEGSGNGYLRTACDYVHLNPVGAKLLAPEDRLLAYPWSSFSLYLSAPAHRPRWSRADRLLSVTAPPIFP